MIFNYKSRVFICFILFLCIIYPAFADTTTLVRDYSFGPYGEGEGYFFYPLSIAMDEDETMYIPDKGRCVVEVFSSNGTFLREWGKCGSSDGEFNDLQSIALSPDGYLYTTDDGKDQVLQFTKTGSYIRSFGTSGSGPGQLDYPAGIAVNSTGYVFVADEDNNRIEVFTKEGAYYGSWNTTTGMPADFSSPCTIDIADDDSVYVGLYESNKIYCFSPDKTILQSWQLPYRVRHLVDITIGPDGYLYAIERGGSPLGESAWIYLCSMDGSIQTRLLEDNYLLNGIAVDDKGGIFCTHRYDVNGTCVTRFVQGTKTPGLPVPQVVWSDPLTETGDESHGNSIVMSSDGGSIETGIIDSDMLVIKRDADGAITWINQYGGTSTDKGSGIIETHDGNYLVIGQTYSEMTGYHNYGDVWVVMLNADGEQLWEKCYGGSYSDAGLRILETDDGTFILTGYTESNDGDVSGNHGLSDIWVVEIDTNGEILWQRCYGGTNNDYGYCIAKGEGDFYILTGYTYSNDDDVSGNHGESDIWVVEINTSGDILWQKCYGGTQYEIGYDIIQTDNNGYILTGYSNSNNWDITGNHGSTDIVGIAISATGDILWQKCYGGSGSEYCHVVQEYNGKYIFTGYTGSTDGDVTGYHGYQDAWVLQTDSGGNLIWAGCYGGTSSDFGYGGASRGDGTYLITGGTYSRDGDVSDPGVGNNGDLWTFLIDEKEADFSASVLSGTAPLTVAFTGMTSSGMKADSWNWYFGDGGISHEQNPVHQYTAPGTYTVRMEVAGPGFTGSMEKPGYITVT